MKQAPAFNFATIEENGTAPASRVPTSNDAFCIADQLRRDNAEREHRWGSVYKCYKRFPPTDYSLLAKRQLMGLSNVNYGQLTFEVDDKKSAYIDMVTDRPVASKIRTRIGNAIEKKVWSEQIETAWNAALWNWDSYFYNVDQDLEEMLLFGKGIEIRDDQSSWLTRSYRNNQVLIPERTRANLDNLGELVIRDSYTPLEFWRKFKDSKDNKEIGWNFWACVDALRYYTNNRDFRLTTTQYLQKVAAGDLNFNQYFNVKIDVYIVFIKEWNGSVTKYIILQNYTPLAQMRGEDSEEQYMDKAGYLYVRENFLTPKQTWTEDLIAPFHGSAGSGLWHEIKGYGEDIFPASRRYDISMNSIMDGVDMEMKVALTGGSADVTKKLKQMEWGRMFVMPEGVDFSQRRIQLPLGDAMAATEKMMQDTYRGVSSFNQVKPRAKQTLGEAELNFQEDAKLDGTQLRRYNICHTRWQKMLYKRFVESTSGSDGYDVYLEFKQNLKEQGVPDEAWTWENVGHMSSNMLPGAGSPANKFIASMKVAEIAGASAANPGQNNAYRDAIAHLAGRENVDAYRPIVPEDVPDEVRVIAFENVGLGNPMANPENIRVMPTDNHIEHIRGHFSDAMVGLDNAMQLIQGGRMDANGAADAVAVALLHGGHISAHMGMLAKDQSKAAIVKQFGQAMSELQSRTDEMINIATEMQQAESQQGPQLSPEERKLELKIAEKQIDLDAKQQSNQLKLAATATRTEQKLEADKERAATDLAIKRANANLDAETKSKARKAGGSSQA
jgi:hypothetical protein